MKPYDARNRPDSMELFTKKIYEYQLEARKLRIENDRYKEQKITALLIGDAINDGIYIINPEGIITDVNQKYCQIVGLSKDEFIGKTAGEITEQCFTKKEAASLQALREKRKIIAITQTKKTSKELLVTACPTFAKDGSIIQIISVLRDITELNQLKEQLQVTRKKTEMYEEELNYLRKAQTEGTEIIGESSVMKGIMELISVVSKSDATILLIGETGVGKEVLAREIYHNSERKNEPYIRVNCAALPETLLESELFGYEKGAFTGANNKGKTGLFEMANNGTLLLDEIGELPLSLQPKLLRVLQERELIRIGGTKPTKLNVRIIASTNRDLLEDVNSGRFRKDLYYRLQVIPVVVPPLRERENDCVLLASYFLKRYNSKYNRQKVFPEEAYDILRNYAWPGNIRELENVIERLVVIMQDDVISPENVKAVLDISSSPIRDSKKSDQGLKESLNCMERDIIEKTLKETGSTYKAAKKLGISQPTVVRKAKSFGIKDW